MTQSKVRTLILGFDGGDPAVFSAFDMPFLEQLLADGRLVSMNEDLLTRGWSEIVTGHTAEATGGLYFRPVSGEKTPRLEIKYSQREMFANPAVKPLWTMLNERGVSYGMMGVPTTSPAPRLDGFAVSGGGGGIGKIDGLPEGYCYPKAIEEHLLAENYEFDVRLSTMAESTFADFVRRVEEVVDSNVRTLQRLARAMPTDVTFMCLRPTTGLQYLARYDIEQAALAKAEGREPTGNAALLKRHYAFLDEQIRKTFEAVRPDRFLLVADHGTAPYRRRVNLNALLQETGYQQPRAQATSLVKNVLRTVKRKLPRTILTRVSKGVQQKLGRMALNFEPATTRAFGHYHVPGIYINDASRFGGPVLPEEVDGLVDELVSLLNANEQLRAEGLEARPFRRRFPGSHAEHELPDIEVWGPDTHFFMGTGPLLSDNPNYRETPADLAFAHNPFSGVKGRNPIFLVDGKTAGLLREDDPANMTLAYKVLERIYPA